MKLIRRMALAFGIAISLLQTGRAVLWWRSPPNPADWPFFIDAYLIGTLLVSGAVGARRQEVVGRLIIAAGWGFSCGILYRSFFEQLRDPTRLGGHEILVLACKGALLALSATGLVVSLSHKMKKEPNQPVKGNASTESASNVKSPARRG